jgi:hypothetical protein
MRAGIFQGSILESDQLPPKIWLKILVQLRIRIVVIYSSGGSSVHSLLTPSAQQFTSGQVP